MGKAKHGSLPEEHLFVLQNSSCQKARGCVLGMLMLCPFMQHPAVAAWEWAPPGRGSSSLPHEEWSSGRTWGLKVLGRLWSWCTCGSVHPATFTASSRSLISCWAPQNRWQHEAPQHRLTSSCLALIQSMVWEENWPGVIWQTVVIAFRGIHIYSTTM